MEAPTDLYYTEDHEWISVDGLLATVGVTDYAQSALGDVVYVALPKVNTLVTAGTAMCEIESTKSVADVMAPVTGRVVEINERLGEDPSLINSDPYGGGWICRVKFTPPITDGLLDFDAYQQLVGQG